MTYAGEAMSAIGEIQKPFLRLTPVRRAVVILLHLALWSGTFLGAFLLRFDFQIPSTQIRGIRIALPVLLLARLFAFAYFGLFRGLWRYTGTRDLVALAKASGFSTGVLILFAVFALPGFPRSIYIIEWLACFMAVAACASPSA
jgi:FlaA1/EpsC-like NDP-sugar epimerase